MQNRLLPPPELHALDETSPAFVPAPEVIDWARDCFIGDDSTHRNPDHDHLELARLGALWTNAPARRQMRSIAGTCEIPTPRGLPAAGVQAAGLGHGAGGLPATASIAGMPEAHAFFSSLRIRVEAAASAIRRYGAAGAGAEEMVEAARKKPEIGKAAIARLCGTCALRVA